MLLRRVQLDSVALKKGALTDSQFAVLHRRGRGLTQRQTARELGTSRANVSMIELRARRKVELARETIRAYEAAIEERRVRIPKGVKFYDIPPAVLREGDRWGIHMQSNIVDIIRMIRAVKPNCLVDGRTNRAIYFEFNPSGRLRLSSAGGRKTRSPSN